MSKSPARISLLVDGDAASQLGDVGVELGSTVPAKVETIRADGVRVRLTVSAERYIPSAAEVSFADKWAKCSLSTGYHEKIQKAASAFARRARLPKLGRLMVCSLSCVT